MGTSVTCTCSFSGVASRFAVGIPKTFDPRPNPFTTGPPTRTISGSGSTGSSSVSCAIQSLRMSHRAASDDPAGKNAAKSRSYSEEITTSAPASTYRSSLFAMDGTATTEGRVGVKFKGVS